MDRPRDWLSVRATLVLPTAVAIISFVTGVANISVTRISGPLAAYVPPSVQQAAGFTGALTGFLMLVSVVGLRRRLRVAWYATVLLLPVTALQGLVQSSALSLPLVALSLLSLPTMVVNRRRFEQAMDVSTSQLAAVAALIGAQVYITVGTYALRDDFANISTVTDALYFAIVTSSTVGYGDAAPMPQSQSARLFTMSVVVLGTASFALALGTVLGPAIQSRISKALGTMTESHLELLEDHVLVLGYGDLTEPILEELQDEIEFVVITPDPDTAATLQQRDIEVLTADPSDEEPLERAGLADARAVVAATNDDARDALSILTANQLNPEIRIVAAATDRENVEKLRRAGADTVISPAAIGGHLIVQSALGQAGMEDVANHILGVESEDDEDDIESP